MWNSTKCTAMAIAAAGLAVTPAFAQSASVGYPNNGVDYRNNGYVGIFGWPAAADGAAGYGLSGAYGYGGSYRAANYGGGLENGQNPSAAAAAPAPERTRPVVRRRGPKRLE